jgi:hypothetical protein
MDRDAGRLVKHEHQPVAIEQARSCFFWRHGPIARPAATLRQAFVPI